MSFCNLQTRFFRHSPHGTSASFPELSLFASSSSAVLILPFPGMARGERLGVDVTSTTAPLHFSHPFHPWITDLSTLSSLLYEYLSLLCLSTPNLIRQKTVNHGATLQAWGFLSLIVDGFCSCFRSRQSSDKPKPHLFAVTPQNLALA